MSIIDANGNEILEEAELDVTGEGGPLLTSKDHKSGEEDYDCIWEQKGKLLRFDEGENAWKERGQGTAKVMKKKGDPGTFMFIFRREAIGKLGAHHYLVKGTTIKLHPQSDKAVTWRAGKDYVDDEEGFPESFVLRFPSNTMAQEAVEQMNKAVKESAA